MGKNTQIAELINYISVNGSGDIVMTGNLIMPGGAQAATQTYVNTAISNLVNAAPTALDTLAELSTALNNDASFATTVTNSIASKLALSGGSLTGRLNLLNTDSVDLALYHGAASSGSARIYYNQPANQLRIYATAITSDATIGIGSLALYNGSAYKIVLTESNIGSYALPLTGGTLTGQLTLTYSGARIAINDGGSNGMTIGLWDGSNCRIESGGRPLYMVSYGGAISIGRSGGNNLVIDTNTLTYAGGTIWRDNNDGSGSGLDADLLDGRNGGDYAQINSGGPSFQGSTTYTGWYKLARSNQNAGGYGPRGAFKITIAATGNYLSPAQDVIFGYKDWVNTIHVSKVESYLSTPFSSYRVTTDSDYTYLEGYVSGFWVGGEQSIAVYCESYGHNGLQWSPLSGYISSGLSSPSSSFAMTKNGSATTYGSIFSSYSEVKAAADGNDLFVGRYSGGSAKLFRVYQSGADGYLELRTGADNIVTRLSGYAGTSSYFLSNVGFGTNDPTHRLDVVGGSGTTPVASFTSGGNSWSEGIYINPSTANGYAGIYYPIAADSQADGMWFTGRITSTDGNFPNGFGFARKGLTGGGIPGWGGNAMNIKQDGTVYFGFDVRHGQNYKGLTFVQLTSCIGWNTSITGNTQTTISTTGLGLPSGVKAISVVGWYHVRNYGAAQGQGDHATAWFGISNDQTPYPWAGTNGGYPYDSNTFTRADYGSFVMEHDGDASIETGSSGGPHYYGSWHNGIINVNANGTIYCNLGSGYSGGTHYFALYIQGYWI